MLNQKSYCPKKTPPKKKLKINAKFNGGGKQVQREWKGTKTVNDEGVNELTRGAVLEKHVNVTD